MSYSLLRSRWATVQAALNGHRLFFHSVTLGAVCSTNRSCLHGRSCAQAGSRHASDIPAEPLYERPYARPVPCPGRTASTVAESGSSPRPQRTTRLSAARANDKSSMARRYAPDGPLSCHVVSLPTRFLTTRGHVHEVGAASGAHSGSIECLSYVAMRSSEDTEEQRSGR